MALEIKQRGFATGYKILLFFYKLLGYRFVVFILNFVALYYLFFTPKTKKFIKDYYQHQDIKFSNLVYFKHIKIFAISILDRFVARIYKNKIKFNLEDKDSLNFFNDGAIAILSHVGGWASAGYSLNNKIPFMHIVMKESTQQNISNLERSFNRHNNQSVHIIDLNQGNMAVNIQIANAISRKEIVAMMVDRVADKNKTVDVMFFGSHVKINKNPFDIAFRIKKTLVAIFIIRIKDRNYNLLFREIKPDTIDNMAQNYMILLEDILRKYPQQWFNFFNFFNP